jgi:hypothetical protein
MHILVGFSLLSFLLSGPPTGPIMPDESDAIHEWPALKQGVWAIEGTVKSKGRKTRKWKATTKRCEDSTSLFQGYWGRGKADKNSCLFQSTKVSSSKFEVVGECLVEQYDVVKSESVVTTKGHDAFEMEVKFQSGKVGSTAKETGHWVSACTEADKAPAEKPAAPEKATVEKDKDKDKDGTADKTAGAEKAGATAEGSDTH